MLHLDQTALLKKALQNIKDLKKALKGGAAREPIAVVSMACRFPGGSDTPERFWDLLAEGREGLTAFPRDPSRKRTVPMEDELVASGMYVEKANFLSEDISLFDPKLFGVSPREAEEMDPQHRMLLELAWEALERAGQPPMDAKERNVGTFIGIIGSEYGTLPRDQCAISPYALTGLTNHMASGRIAHIFGLQGPAISVDTACSSSLVAIHYACESLLNNDCRMAIAGGVGLMVSEVPFLSLCKAHALSKDGRCKPFSSEADGYGRGEGAGLVVLKRLSKASQDGDPILAVIQATGVNHDGPSSGLTVPNGKAQEKLILETIHKAGIEPGEIGYYETHGTGTPLGDPIEFQSLRKVFGESRGEGNPLILGTCKANIGHLEAASGIAGFIKTVLCLQRKAIPPHINCTSLNSRVRLEDIPAALPKTLQAWPVSGGKRRFAGISSFGFSGTNANLIVAEAPVEELEGSAPARPVREDRQTLLLALSAQTRPALCDLVGRYDAFFSDPSLQNPDAAVSTANRGRTHFPHRLAIAWTELNELRTALKSFHESTRPGGRSFASDSEAPKVGTVSLIFSGTMSVEPAKLRSLLENSRQFRDSWAACRNAFGAVLERPLADPADDGKTGDVGSLENEALAFSAAYGVFALLRYWGIRIQSVYAEKEGIFAMAAATGMVTLEEAVKSLAARYSGSAPSPMELRVTEFKIILPGLTHPVGKQDLRNPRLLEDAFRAVPQYAEIADLLGTNPGDRIELDVEPCVMRRIFGEGLPSETGAALFHSDSYWSDLVRFTGQCYAKGQSIDWTRFEEGRAEKKVVCPTYPFQRKSLWINVFEPTQSSALRESGPSLASGSGLEYRDPFAGELVSSPLAAKQSVFGLGTSNLPALKDTHGLVHIGFFFEMLRSGSEAAGHAFGLIQSISFDVALLIAGNERKVIQLVMEPGENGSQSFSFHSHSAATGLWIRHVHGTVTTVPPQAAPPAESLANPEIKTSLGKEWTGPEFYLQLEERGVVVGPSVQWIDRVWRKDGEALARFRSQAAGEGPFRHRFGVNPGIWDACAQLFHATLNSDSATDSHFMVSSLGDIRFTKSAPGEILYCHAVSRGKSGENGQLEGRFAVYNEAFETVATCSFCRMKELSASHVEALKKAGERREGKRNDGLLLSFENASDLEAKTRLIADYLLETFETLLKIPRSELDGEESIGDLGFDSLVGLEFINTIKNELNLDLPIDLLIQGPSLRALGETICVKLMTGVRNGIEPVSGPAYGPNGTGFVSADRTPLKPKRVNGVIKPKERIKLFCFPYGISPSAIFRNWEKLLPPEIEVRPIELPGRGERLNERPFENADELAEFLTEITREELDEPYAIYGHSVGSLVGYSWCKHLQAANLPLPRHLFVSAYSAPCLTRNPVLEGLRTLCRTRGLAGIPTLGEILNPPDAGLTGKMVDCLLEAGGRQRTGFDAFSVNREYIAAQLPASVSAFRMVELSDPASQIPLWIPITALHGRKDTQVAFEEIQAWKTLTLKSFTTRVFSGDHLFMDPAQNETEVTGYIGTMLMEPAKPQIHQTRKAV